MRERAQIDLGGPLLREREGCRLTGRSLSQRLAEIVDRLGRVAEASAPDLPPHAWDLVCWVGWDALTSERICSHPSDVDALVWQAIVVGVEDWADEEARRLAPRLRKMTSVERIAVLERIEAYGRMLAETAEAAPENQR